MVEENHMKVFVVVENLCKEVREISGTEILLLISIQFAKTIEYYFVVDNQLQPQRQRNLQFYKTRFHCIQFAQTLQHYFVVEFNYNLKDREVYSSTGLDLLICSVQKPYNIILQQVLIIAQRIGTFIVQEDQNKLYTVYTHYTTLFCSSF